MKKMRIAAVVCTMMMAGTVCAQDKAWPWDFPQGVKIEAEPGQKVLSCESLWCQDTYESHAPVTILTDGISRKDSS